MNKGFYARLAADNIRKNAKTYVPYIITCIVTVMMFYMVNSLSTNPGLQTMYGGGPAAYILRMGVYVTALFSFIFLFYTNSFLIKRRKKEFGLFNVLGLEKKHLSRLLFLENLYVAAVSLAAGIGFGMVLDKLMFLLVTKAIGIPVTLGFYVSGKVVGVTAILFCGVFLLIYLKSVGMLHLSNPAELLRGENEGEKEPKAKWLLALLGVAALAAGYYIAITVDNPIASLEKFLIAVVLVIIATYLLFTAGSIALLKLLRKNERFYYKPRHFISVSGMIYRMKQNAAGLANICILSTMVLVMISTTGSMMVGLEDIIKTRIPNNFCIFLEESSTEQREILQREVGGLIQREQLPVERIYCYSYFTLVVSQRDNAYAAEEDEINIVAQIDNVRVLYVLPVSDYNAAAGENISLADREVLMYYDRGKCTDDSAVLFDTEYRIVRGLKEFPGNGWSTNSIFNCHYMVVSDESFEIIRQSAEQSLGVHCPVEAYYGFDTDAAEEVQETFCGKLRTMLYELSIPFSLETRLGVRSDFLGLYGGLFFLGVFLGVLFTMATVLIIYYKQISEGYEDRERFAIMQKVGMSHAEVKAAIHSQVLTVFFLPLLTAGIHMAAAFPILKAMLALLNMTNIKLYTIFTVICFLAFAAVYTAVYSLTAKTYYKIVSR